MAFIFIYQILSCSNDNYNESSNLYKELKHNGTELITNGAMMLVLLALFISIFVWKSSTIKGIFTFLWMIL